MLPQHPSRLLAPIDAGNVAPALPSVSNNNLVTETNYVKATEVEGESKEVGAKVIYQGREMIVSTGVGFLDGRMNL